MVPVEILVRVWDEVLARKTMKIEFVVVFPAGKPHYLRDLIHAFWEVSPY